MISIEKKVASRKGYQRNLNNFNLNIIRIDLKGVKNNCKDFIFILKFFLYINFQKFLLFDFSHLLKLLEVHNFLGYRILLLKHTK